MTTTGSGPASPGQDPRYGSRGEQSYGDRTREEADRLRREAESAAEEASEGFREQADQARHGAEDLKDEVSRRASGLVDEAKARVRSTIEERKSGAAEDIADVAHALRTGAHDLDEHHKQFIARYVYQAADGLDRMADQLRHEDFGAFWDQVEGFARRQPGLVMGGAFVVGFALARFVKSSADRERRNGDWGRSGEGDPYGRYEKRGSSDRDRESWGRYGRADSPERQGGRPSSSGSGIAGTGLGASAGPVSPASANPGSAFEGDPTAGRPDRR